MEEDYGQSADPEAVEEGSHSDEYHEDDLPDLVLASLPDHTSHNSSTSPHDSLDLLTLASSVEAVGGGGIHHWNEAEYVANGSGTTEEVVTEISSSQRDVYKISYVDHTKAYVARVRGGADRYRSYLSLMPEEASQPNHTDEVDPLKQDQGDKTTKFLADFTALSYEEQMRQRLEWVRDLEKTDNEIAELKEKLAFKTAWCGVLRRNLGISKWRHACAEFGGKVNKITEKTTTNLQNAIEVTESRLLSSQSLRLAKDSFEQLSSEVRERVRQGARKVAVGIPRLDAVDKPLVDSNDNKLNNDGKTKKVRARSS